MDDVEAAFLAAIQRDPDDDAARMVYADWLDERGDPRGELLRLEIQLHRGPARMAELERLVDATWQRTVSRRFTVELVEVGANKIAVIKIIRGITSLGLKESKDLVDLASWRPVAITTGVLRDAAERIIATFGSEAKLRMVSAGQIAERDTKVVVTGIVDDQSAAYALRTLMQLDSERAQQIMARAARREEVVVASALDRESALRLVEQLAPYLRARVDP